MHVLSSCVSVSLTTDIILPCQTVDCQKATRPGVLGRRANGGFHARVAAGRKQFARHEWAQKAAYLLGCTLEELSSSIFKHQAKGTLPRASAVRQAADENGTADAGKPHALLPQSITHVPRTVCHSVSTYTRVCSSTEGKCMLYAK